MRVEILYDNLEDEEAYKLEYETIIDYINNKGYGIDIEGLRGNDDTHFLTNQTFGSRGSVGISNPMYGVSPKQRMSEEKYKEWLKNAQARLSQQVGEKNPNYHNDTLHNKVKDNPELRIQYYSRPGGQNGRARTIEVYDIDGNYLTTFNYIGECCEWLKEKLHIDSKINSMRSNITIRTKKNKPYLNHYFKFI